MNCFMCVKESKDFSFSGLLERKVPGYVVADKLIRDSPEKYA